MSRDPGQIFRDGTEILNCLKSLQSTLSDDESRIKASKEYNDRYRPKLLSLVPEIISYVPGNSRLLTENWVIGDTRNVTSDLLNMVQYPMDHNSADGFLTSIIGSLEKNLSYVPH